MSFISAPIENPNINDSNLESFDTTKMSVGDMSAYNKRGIITGTVVNQDAKEKPPETEEVSEGDSDDKNYASSELEDDTDTETLEDDDSSSSSPFSQEFERAFGIKPNEAVELVNSLQAFKDEQSLMRSWGVDPVTYDNRMSQIREFYKTLPEDGRQKFNTVEGADAIWKHLVDTGKVQESKKTPTTTNNRVKRAVQKPAYDFTRSQITRMPKDEYQQKLPLIVKAFQQGRVSDE